MAGPLPGRRMTVWGRVLRNARVNRQSCTVRRNGEVAHPGPVTSKSRSLMKTFRVQARVAAFVGAIVLLLFGGQISQAQAQTYSYAFQFGSYGTDDGQFGSPSGVALDASGNI